MVRRLVEDETEKKINAFIASGIKRGLDKETLKVREAWIKRVYGESKFSSIFIVEEEFEWAREVVDNYKRFRCPFWRGPYGCDGHLCGLDFYDGCLEFLKANLMLQQVARGEVRVQWRTMKVRL